MPVTRGFSGKRRGGTDSGDRVPPGQHVTQDFPVLSAGPTPHTQLARWSLTLRRTNALLAQWNWEQFGALPQTERTFDIHCVTKWTKLDTRWRGVMFDDLVKAAGLIAAPGPYVMAQCDGGYTTNLPWVDLVDGKAMVVTHFDGQLLAPEHGGPARLLVPHLYFWKSAKWLRGFDFMDTNVPGFWEARGYHIYGDPWREQRYTGD
jgi:DMSO/TMAO reductase YedYZ molybdopterin-dependent catalytic subunit